MADETRHDLAAKLPHRRPGQATKIVLVAVLIIAAARVISTWPVFSQTYDESAHIAAGMEWLELGTYTGEPQHPPLARILAAAGPFLAGARLTPGLPLPQQGNEILHSGPYVKMLSLARAGILPFFLLSIVVVWLYAFRLAGDVAAIIAAILYANLPPVLAHAGLATTDMAVTAGVVWSAFAFHTWLLHPSRGRAVLVGLSVALAFVSKFSSGLFVAVVFLVTAGCFIASRRSEKKVQPRVLATHALIALLVFSFATLAVYRFHFDHLRGANREFVVRLLQGNPIHDSVSPLLDRIVLPAPEIAGGLAQMLLHNRRGHPSYLLCEHKMGGWWDYFPIAIAVKTTIPFLIAAIAALVLIFRNAWHTGRWHLMAPILAAIGIVLVCLPADINIGVRHVLPIYPLMAVAVGIAAGAIWRRGKAARVALIALVVVEIATSAIAHPDYLAYFNPLAGREPHRVLIDSNLDWGQDLLRLSKRARELGIEELRLSYFGTADLTRHDLPALLTVTYDKPSPGWFAVSEGNIGSASYPVTFKWLDQFEPVERVGKSIRLYRIPGATEEAMPLEGLIPLLVPLQLGTTSGGPTWTATLELTNSSDRNISVRDRTGRTVRISGGATIEWPAETAHPSTILYVAPADAPAIDGSVTVSSSTAGGPLRREMQIPLVKENDFSSGPLRLKLTQVCAGCRRMLRIFDLGTGGSVDVSINESPSEEWLTRQMILIRSDSVGGDAAYAQARLDVLFPELANHESAELVIAGGQDPSVRLWAFLTVTRPDGSDLQIATAGKNPPSP